MDMYQGYATGYMIGDLLGRFAAGALIGGLVPMIIFAYKKQAGLGIFGMVSCGMLAFAHPIASIVCGIGFLVGAIRTYNNRN